MVFLKYLQVTSMQYGYLLPTNSRCVLYAHVNTLFSTIVICNSIDVLMAKMYKYT